MGTIDLITQETGPETGVEVVDLHANVAFESRRLHPRDVNLQMEGMQRLGRAFVENPDTILQELVNAAVDLCGADSAGISLEEKDSAEVTHFRWVATAGTYTPYLNAILPRYPSPCGTCLDRDRPQLFRVNQPFFDLLGVQAPLVTDGILLPWQAGDTRGTIWIVAHGRTEAFDSDDVRMMQFLANFAAMGIRQQRQQKLLMRLAGVTAASAMANELAHRINNPLQSLTNQVYLAASGQKQGDAKSFAKDISNDLQRLSTLVAQLLEIPSKAARPN
jgi:two-component sensor histidine kinase